MSSVVLSVIECALASWREFRGPKAAITDVCVDFDIALSLELSLAANGLLYITVVIPSFRDPDTVI